MTDVGFRCGEGSEGAERREAAEIWALREHRVYRGRRRGAEFRALGRSTGFWDLTPGVPQQPGIFGPPVLEPHLGREGTGGKWRSRGASSTYLCPGVRMLR